MHRVNTQSALKTAAKHTEINLNDSYVTVDSSLGRAINGKEDRKEDKNKF